MSRHLRPVRPRWWIRSPLALLAAALLVGGVSSCGDDRPDTDADADTPNLVLILTDDQTLAELEVMTRTRELIGGQGTTFRTSLTDFPLCCPSRATHLTGQAAHNHGVLDNIPPDGGVDVLDHDRTLAVWLDEAGYATSFVGHYLNGYGNTSPPFQPPGWDRWFSTVDPSTLSYWGFEVLADGERRTYGTADDEYQTDVLAQRAVSELERLAAGGDPFFLAWWPLAPHSGSLARGQPNVVSPAPAPRHQGRLAGQPAPRQEATHAGADLATKPVEVRDYAASMLDEQGGFVLGGRPLDELLDETWQARRESLLAVDEAVERLVTTLDATGELDDTVIVFTSDNGWMYGEHGLWFTKSVAYEPSVRVPLLIRGPGFPAGSVVEQLATNVDVATTLTRLGGARPDVTQDGIDLRELIGDPRHLADRAVLLQGHPGTRFSWTAVRTARFTLVEWPSGARELYDLDTDPAQATNLAGRPGWAAVEARLARALGELRSCAGSACVGLVPAAELPAPEPDPSP